MKILYLTTTGTLGGAELCLLDMMASLGAARPDWPLALILGEDGPLREEAEALGVSCRVMPLPAAVAPDRFRPDGPAADLDAASGLAPAPPGTVRVGLVATFATWKGQDVFLEAAARVPADLPARFYIVGGPLYRTGGSQWTREELA